MPISSARFSPKTDNNKQAFAAKVAIRRNVLDAVGKQCGVFDAFAGSGEMYSAVWKDAKHYTGCDMKPQRDGRLMFCADNRRVLRAVDLARFGIFDLDSYGSPWVQAIIIADRRRVAPGELFGLILTEGAGFAYKSNIVPQAIAILTGLRTGIVGLSKKQDAVIDKAIAGLARRMNCTVEKRWQAEGGAPERRCATSGSCSKEKGDPGPVSRSRVRRSLFSRDLGEPDRTLVALICGRVPIASGTRNASAGGWR